MVRRRESGWSLHDIRQMNRARLVEFVEENAATIGETEALAVLENRFCSAEVCVTIAQASRLTSHYAVRAALVANRHTPQGYSMRLVANLYWRDLAVLSTDVKILPPVRRAIDTQLRTILKRLTLGERKTLARLCSREMIPEFLDDPEPMVFESLLVNPRLSEETVIRFIEHGDPASAQIRVLSDHARWNGRYAVRLAIVLSDATPKAVAASMLRHLNRVDVERIFASRKTSQYIRQCIERLGLLERSPNRGSSKRQSR